MAGASEAQYTYQSSQRKRSRRWHDDCFALARFPSCEERSGHATNSLSSALKGKTALFLSPPAQGIRMRLILRILGTWLIGLALVLLVIDGTKSLGANALVFTSLSDLWMQVHTPSLEGVRAFFASRFFADLLDNGLNTLLTYPAFAVFGIPGIIVALAGRTPRRERFLRQDQI